MAARYGHHQGLAMSRLMSQIARVPVLSLGSALVWGVLELVALQRARRTTQGTGTSSSGNKLGARNRPSK